MANERILVTGAGGIAGVNFVRALRASANGYHIVGTEYSPYYIHLPDVDARYRSPRHDSKGFVERIRRVAVKEDIDFIHPQPSSEALVLSSRRRSLPAPVLLPKASVMRLAQDKLASQVKLRAASVRVAKTRAVASLEDLETAFGALGKPVWVRARHGAGGRLSLLCHSAREVRLWVELWNRRRVPIGEFVIQEYLPGRNIAWDSLWLKGKLVTSYCRERLEYPFKHISPSGITGTPSVARTIEDRRIDREGERSVRAVAPNATGAFSVDLKEDQEGRPAVTEADAGKFHTTMPLWGYAAVRTLGLPWYSNTADLYVRMGLGEAPPNDVPKHGLVPQGYTMVRNIDSGVLLMKEDGWKERIL